MYKILLATEGSKGSSKAEQEALKLAIHFNAQVTALAVLPEYKFSSEPAIVVLPESQRQLSPELLQKLDNAAEKVLENVESQFKEKGVEIKTKRRRGQVSKVICEEAAEGEFDLVIMGKRGFVGDDAPPIGKISHKVAHYSPVNVQLVD